MVALDILHKWRNKGGRFLKLDEKTRLWNDVGDKKARQRIAKALKHYATAKNMKDACALNKESSDISDGSNVSNESEAIPSLEQPSTSIASRRISTKLGYKREGKLYGRKTQHKELVELYRKVMNDSTHQFVLISGELGTGKTALASSLQSIVENDDGYFLEAKFEQIGQESTAALVSALSDFVSQLLQRDADMIELYRAAVQTAVEEEARILVSHIPQLKKLLGPEYKGTFTTVEVDRDHKLPSEASMYSNHSYKQSHCQNIPL